MAIESQSNSSDALVPPKPSFTEATPRKKSYLVKLFSGRLNRSAFYSGLPVAIGGLFLIYFLISIVVSLITKSTSVFEICFPIFIVFYTFFISSLTVRRLHDMNHTGLLTLIVIPSLIGIGLEFFAALSQSNTLIKILENNVLVTYYNLSYIFGFYLLARPGTNGSNKYGSPSYAWTIKEIFCLAEPHALPEKYVTKKNILLKPMLIILCVLASIVILILLFAYVTSLYIK